MIGVLEVFSLYFVYKSSYLSIFPKGVILSMVFCVDNGIRVEGCLISSPVVINSASSKTAARFFLSLQFP